MNKKKNRENFDLTNERIEKEEMGKMCEKHMMIFGANNNLMRHIPMYFDGLKPGERRILYTMYSHYKSKYNGRFNKVSGIVGITLELHPHGETPVYKTLVKLAQPWNTNVPLIDGNGNFGSPEGDSAGASRYIEARLSYYAYKCFFEEFDTCMVDMVPNFTNEKMEPEYLPAKYPNILANGAFGIGYGASVGVPPHNFTEVLKLTLELLDNPDLDEVFLLPDIPSGASLVDSSDYKGNCATGKGKFTMRGQVDVDEDRHQLSIKSTPLQVSLKKVCAAIIKLDEDKKIRGFMDILDEGEDIKIDKRLVFKKEVDLVSARQMIYKKTNLQDTFSVNFKLIDDYQDIDYNLKQLLTEWIEMRIEIKRRLYNHQLISVKERQHILEILIFILNSDNAESTMALVKSAENRKEIVDGLMTLYGISSLQAETIASMRITGFSKESRRKYKEEKDEIDPKVKKLEKITRSNKKIIKIIKEELLEGIELFGRERRSELITIDNEIKVRDTNHVVVFTSEGFIKKLPEDSKGIGYVAPGDYPMEILCCKNTDEILIFDQTGKISKVPIHTVHGSTLDSRGELLSTYAKVNGKIANIMPKPSQEVIDLFAQTSTNLYLIMVTKNGIIKKTEASNYVNIRNELLGMVIKDGDELKTIKLLVGDKDIVIYTNKGFGNRFNTTEIKPTSRMSIGVKSIDLGENEETIGMEIVNETDKYLFALTNKGTGKKCTLKAFPVKERNNKPLRIITLDSSEEVMIIKTIKGDEKFKAFLKNSIEEINMEDVVELPRLSKGKKLIGVRKGEVIIDIKKMD